jgi:SSS family solute:Na+ symporter
VWVVVRALVGDPSRGDTAYLKDALMVIAMAVLIVAVPADYVGGIGNPFDRIMQMRPDLIAVQSGTAFDQTGWLTGVLISAIGRGFMTPAPSSLSAVARGRRPEVLRRNDVWLPIYQLVIILPVIIGFVGVLALPKETPSNDILLTRAAGALPAWLTGVIAVATIPLVLGITRPDLMANLLLLTSSGLAARSGVHLPRGADDRAKRSANNSYTPVRSRAERTDDRAV